MENAFEKSVKYLAQYATMKDKQAARDFGQSYYLDDERMIAIMENLIENRGMFKP